MNETPRAPDRTGEAIEKVISIANVDVSPPRSAFDEAVIAARTELRMLMDCALIVRALFDGRDQYDHEGGWFTDAFFGFDGFHLSANGYHGDSARTWDLVIEATGERRSGPIVNGLPVLDETARRALEGT